MPNDKCPKCESENIRKIEIMEYDPGNIFGFTEEDYDAQKNRRCLDCDYEWRLEEEENSNYSVEHSVERLEDMTISQIADFIFSDWKNVRNSALPYLEAMQNLDELSDTYGNEDAKSVISHFLMNSRQWKGENARKVKKFLKEKLGMDN